MGFYLDWVAVEGLSKDEVFARLGLVATDEPTDWPDRGRSMFAMTPSGRVIVISNRYGWLTPAHLEMLSKDASLVAARAEANDCTSSAWGYTNGVRVWAVEHAYEEVTDDDDGLVVEGNPPAELATIRARQAARHRSPEDLGGDHMFEVPIELAAGFIGWAPESDVGDDLEFFTARHVAAPGDTATSTRSKIPLLLTVGAIVGAIVVFKVLFPG